MSKAIANVSLGEDYAQRVARRQEELQSSFDTAFRIQSPEQRAVVDDLLEQIGKIDWEIEGYSSPENQRDLSIKFHWGHDHKFADDLFINGRMGARHLSLMAEFLEGFDLPDTHFKEKAVLDVGCWTGGTTLALKLLGAWKIRALEEVRKYADVAQTLLSGVYDYSDVECVPISLYEFRDGKFDSVYLPGVIYHLSDPVVALRRMFNRLKDGGDILVESAGIDSGKAVARFDGNRVYHSGNKEEMNRGGWNWFIPSPTCLGLWMEEAGFEGVQVYYSPVTRRVFAYAKRNGYRDITRAGLSAPDIE